MTTLCNCNLVCVGVSIGQEKRTTVLRASEVFVQLPRSPGVCVGHCISRARCVSLTGEHVSAVCTGRRYRQDSGVCVCAYVCVCVCVCGGGGVEWEEGSESS